jgi:hypothetical protein
MKNGMKTKFSQGKISNFLRDLKRPNKSESELRVFHRQSQMYPNSVKIGAGSVTARRRLPALILHKRDHRSNQLIGFKY